MPDFMDIAIQQAKDGIRLGHGGPFGACIVQNGKLISAAHNQVLQSNDPTMHAEMQAISMAGRTLGRFDLSDCELYTSCEPCPMCLGAIYWARIKKVYYACTQDDAAAIGFDDRKFYIDIRSGKTPDLIEVAMLGRQKALAVFDDWKTQADRKVY
jgi:guanine deaminase